MRIHWRPLAAVGLLATLLVWWRWPYLQLSRAEEGLENFPAPYSLYWPESIQQRAQLRGLAQAEALTRITRAVEAAESRLGPTAKVVYLRGRLAAQRGDSGEAIRLLNLATLLDPADVSLHVAYAVSFGLRAAMENRPIDWATAANVLLTASEMPGFPALGFANLAEVSEHIPAPQAAIQYWKQAAAQEAGTLKARFLERQRQAEEQLRRRDLRVRQTLERREPSPAISGSGELLFQQSLAEWLPRRTEFATDLARLAEYLREEMSDDALLDLLAGSTNREAEAALASAARANALGDYRTAAEAGMKARKLYIQSGNAAGQTIAAAQGSYALRRTGQHAECREIAEDALRLSIQKGYRWAELRNAQELMACKSRQRVIDMLVEREDVAGRTLHSGFLDLELRAASSLVEPSHGFTAPAESWARGQQGLMRYWQSVLPAPFATNFYSPLGLMAESFGYSRLAALLFRESMAVMEGHPNQWLRDAIRADFLRLDPGARLPGPTTSEIETAARELAAGDAPRAHHRLQRLTQRSAFPYREFDYDHRVTLLPVMGRALWMQGRRTEALRHYRGLVDETVALVKTLHGRRQRQATALEIGPAWRMLAEAQLDTEGPTEALRTWQTFRTLANPGRQLVLSPPPGEIRLAVALLPAGPVVWWSDAQGIAVHRIRNFALTRHAERFAALVANPDSPLEFVNDTGRDLYGVLIAPFEKRLSGAHTLVVDPDGPLAQLPWGALRDAQGRTLLSRLAVVQTIGWGSPAANTADVDWQPALLVAEPAVAPQDRARFPVLNTALREADHLRNLFPQHLFLTGQQASVDALQLQITKHRLFHFAGHGVANGGNGALVLAGEPRSGTRLVTASEIASLDLRSLRLATLAACSSGTGENLGSVNVESLVQAFLDAGTRQVLAARWNVDSRSTSQVMGKFYGRLRRGMAPATALREASLEVAQDPAQRHPYFWAAFQLFGLP